MVHNPGMAAPRYRAAPPRDACHTLRRRNDSSSLQLYDRELGLDSRPYRAPHEADGLIYSEHESARRSAIARLRGSLEFIESLKSVSPSRRILHIESKFRDLCIVTGDQIYLNPEHHEVYLD